MSRGTLYGVGVGPGDPQLLTLRAADAIRRCPVVAAPRTPRGGMAALDIAAGAVDLEGKTIIPLDFAMSRDAAARERLHHRAADALRPHLDKGSPVALLSLGDVSLYSSFRYVADILGPEGYPIDMIPGVTSFAAAAARLGVSLADRDTPIVIIPDADAPAEAPAVSPTRIWMKSGRRLPELLAELRERGVADRALVVQNCGMADERVYRGLEGDTVADGYFTVTIVRGGGGGDGDAL